jgi:hypothetical protein
MLHRASGVAAGYVPGQLKTFAHQLGWTNDVEAGGGAAAGEDESYFGALQDTMCCNGLSFQQRITGFLLCLLMGVVFIMIAMSFVPMLALFPKKFAFFFTCGNAFSVSATSFLVGPASQLKSMFESHRAQAAAGYLMSTSLTLISALYWRSAVLSVVFAAAQIVSVVWYALSYVPFARRVVSYVWSWAAVVVKPVLSAIAKVVWTCCSKLCMPKC